MVLCLLLAAVIRTEQLYLQCPTCQPRILLNNNSLMKKILLLFILPLLIRLQYGVRVEVSSLYSSVAFEV